MISEIPVKKRNQEIKRVVLLGLGLNVFLVIIKMAAGWFGNSHAVMADAIHSLSDLSTDLGLLIGLYFWSKPRDEDHPYGHGRLEQIVTLFLALVLVITGVAMLYNSFGSILERNLETPRWWTLPAAFISIISKEFIYQYSARIARKIHSSALLANAWHHRSDALSSIPVVISVAVALRWPELRVVDQIGAIIVSFLIIRAAGQMAFPSIGQLVDTTLPPALGDEIIKEAGKIKGVEQAHALRARYIGSEIAIDLHLEVNPELTVREGHDIAELAAGAIQQSYPQIVDVVTHIEPAGSARSNKLLD